MSKAPEVSRRNETFADKTETRIWHEKPSDDNPYNAQQCLCHGYDILELAQKRSFADVLFLLFRGELPNPQEARTLETLLILFINPGPRHASTRSAMTASISKADPGHLLPISLGILSATDVGESIRFFRKSARKPANEIAKDLLSTLEHDTDSDRIIAPGFGSSYGSVDNMAQHYAQLLQNLPGEHQALSWGMEFARQIKHENLGWLATGVVAATLSDLGFRPNAGTGLYQLLSAPGLLAHGLEMSNKPITAMPFISDEHYVIEQ